MVRRALPIAIAVLLVAAPAAAALIVPQQGMKGVRLGMTREQVRDELGRPDKVRHVTGGELPPSFTVYRYGLTRISFHSGTEGQVFSITTTSRRERTSRGVGVGSLERDVRAKVRGVRCVTEFGTRHCHVGEFRPGRRVTDFFINRRGRVSRVSIGRVLD